MYTVTIRYTTRTQTSTFTTDRYVAALTLARYFLHATKRAYAVDITCAGRDCTRFEKGENA
jgi:hypothetical protein